MMLQAVKGYFGSTLPVGPITFVGSAAAGVAGQAPPPTTANITFNMSDLRDAANNVPTLQEHDFVVVSQVCGRLGTDIISLHADPGSSMTIRQELQSTGSTFTSSLFIYHKFMGSPVDTTLSIPNSGHVQAGMGYAVHVFRGVDLTTPFDVADVTATANGHSSPNPGATTPASAGAWIYVVGGGADNAAVTLTNPGDLSATTNHFRAANGSDTVHGGIGAGIKTNWASGAFNPAQFGGGVSDAINSWVAATLVLRSAP